MMRGYFPGSSAYFGSMMGINGMWLYMGLRILGWIAIVWLVIWIVKRFSGSHPAKNSEALDIVRERYARGEINKEQYDQLIKDLK